MGFIHALKMKDEFYSNTKKKKENGFTTQNAVKGVSEVLCVQIHDASTKFAEVLF